MPVFDQIAVFGCKATTQFLLDNLNIPHPIRYLITIDPAGGEKHDVADYCDLKAAAEARGIEVYQARYYSLKHPDDQAHIRSLKIDIAFVIGWQRLIPAEVLSGLTVGAFGIQTDRVCVSVRTWDYHGSAFRLVVGGGGSGESGPPLLYAVALSRSM